MIFDDLFYTLSLSPCFDVRESGSASLFAFGI